MNIYKTKIRSVPGTDFNEIYHRSYCYYLQIKRKSRRRPYVRSKYFNKNKIFLELFWRRLFENKNWRDRSRRSKFFPAAIELIKRSQLNPASIENPNNRTQILHRFSGITKDNCIFYVQIKEEKKTGEKWLMSVFPETKKTFR